MPTPENPFPLFRFAGEQIEPVAAGDMVILLRRNGAVQLINSCFDNPRLDFSSEALTDVDREISALKKKAVALAIAATNPKLMEMLLEAASDPAAIEALKAQTGMHS